MGDVGMNVIGNILGSEGLSKTYEAYDSGSVSIYQLGGPDDVAATSLYRHGNFDFVNMDTLWADGNDARELPPSLYYQGRPGWWPEELSWPWVGPDLQPMTRERPAKVRSDALRAQ